MSSYSILSRQDIYALPPLRWLVKGVIPQQSFGVLWGPAGVGKSFVALDLAHSIGLGNSWFSHDSEQGNVLYVSAGEGGYGLKYRVKAWEKYNGSPVENVDYGLDPVQLHDASSVRRFISAVTPHDYSLIVFDTLARCAVGVDENSVQGMGPVVQGVDRIRETTGAAVVLVHHAGKPGEDGHLTYRGSSSLEGAADTMMQVGKEAKDKLWIRCGKQKDGSDFWPIPFKLKSVTWPKGESAVVVKR